MGLLMWDASAIVKRYQPELGSAVVDALFTPHPGITQVVAVMGYVEAAAVLRRSYHRGTLKSGQLRASRDLLERELMCDPCIRLLSIGDREFLMGLELTDRYSLNSADAAVLYAMLSAIREHSDQRALLVAADRRFLRAAGAEGLPGIDPESTPLDDVTDLLATLAGD